MLDRSSVRVAPTTKSSTETTAPVAAGFLVPVACTRIRWAASARPLTSTDLVPRVREYRSTGGSATPSTETLAMPALGPVRAVQVTAVPVNANDATEPGTDVKRKPPAEAVESTAPRQPS